MDGYEYQHGRRGSIYMQVSRPNKPDRPTVPHENGSIIHESPSEYNPTEWVQAVINSVRDEGHKVHSVFSEMDVLRKYNDTYEWRESARWVKYEEVVEEGGKRWSKPHVASLSMQSLFDLRNALADGVVLLDFDCYSLPQAVDKILDEWIESGQLDPKMRSHVRDISLKYHKHGHVKRNKSKGSKLGDIPDESLEDRRSSLVGLSSVPSFASFENGNLGTPSSPDLLNVPSDSNLGKYKPNTQFMRKIPKDAEAANVMVGEVDDLQQRVVALVRLKEPRLFEQICEVNLPTKFLFFCFGPQGGSKNFMELGRCVGTMMVDEIFREVAYKGRTKEDILAGMDEFMEQVTVLPPGEWDPKIRIEPPTKVQSQEFRKVPSTHSFGGNGKGGGDGSTFGGGDDDHGGHGDDPALFMSKIPFYGLVKDIKRKVPFYLSDFKDAIHIQCLASFVYVFLGTMTPNVTFGGLLGEATDQYMGVMECIFAAAVTGILFALFSGQPMNILGSTGPMLVLETIIYNLCKDNNWDFMPARFWVGMWTVLFILLIVIFNLSALVKYITRFTEESFATLIALIFIVEAFKKLLEIEHDAPMNLHPLDPIPQICECAPGNCSADALLNYTSLSANYSCDDVQNTTKWWNGLSSNSCSIYGGMYDCEPKRYVGDVFLLSILLFLGTFAIAIALVDFKRTTIFPNVIRQRLSDFGVLIAILVMVGVDAAIGIDTPKLIVPNEFKPTKPGRGWFVYPFSDKNPWWLYLAAAVPALLSTILIFLDQQITAVIVNRKENKLKKGVGYHLDMFIVAICVALHSILGLPWYVAATVSALAHINSLKKESDCTAPGEKPTFLGVREQRVTALAIGVLSGLAVLITSVLKFIPMPVLYGVFFFMGFQALRGMQLVERLFLFIQPVKYQPDLPYVRHVPLMRIHLFTFIQIVCLAILWAVKTIKVISIAFPLMVLATGVVRKLLECVYSNEELRWIDDLLPGARKDKKEKENDSKVPYSTFIGSSNGSLSDSKETVMSKPAFYVSDECELPEKRKEGTGNTKL